MNPVITNAMTVDVEDYFHVTGFESHIARRDWSGFESRLHFGMNRILQKMDACGIKATFFMLGWLARRYPRLVRQIDAAGHEIGSHSYWHRQVFRLTPRVFRADLRRSQRVLEDVLGKPIYLYRAPSFSITNRSRWAFDVLAEEGITIDSSVFPAAHDRYGIADASPLLHVVPTQSGPIWEAPPAVHCAGRIRMPVGGGGYFRLYPIRWTLALLGRINTAGNFFTFYVHPWEFDPDQPRLGAGSRLSRWRHYTGLHATERKFLRLLSAFRFDRLGQVVAQSALGKN